MLAQDASATTEGLTRSRGRRIPVPVLPRLSESGTIRGTATPGAVWGAPTTRPFSPRKLWTGSGRGGCVGWPTGWQCGRGGAGRKLPATRYGQDPDGLTLWIWLMTGGRTVLLCG